MDPLKWHPFDKSKGYRQKRPPIRKYVLVLGSPNRHGRQLVAVGYRKDAAGDKDCPYFVVPSIGGEVVAWCDCLPSNFAWPKENRDER